MLQAAQGGPQDKQAYACSSSVRLKTDGKLEHEKSVSITMPPSNDCAPATCLTIDCIPAKASSQSSQNIGSKHNDAADALHAKRRILSVWVEKAWQHNQNSTIDSGIPARRACRSSPRIAAAAHSSAHTDLDADSEAAAPRTVPCN